MRSRPLVLLLSIVLLAMGACVGSHPQRPTDRAEELSLTELFPGVRIDARAGVVEFDAQVSLLLVNDPRTPLIYLEVLCCIPDSREHESLLVTRARPSHIHAALLSVGAQPGQPGGFRWSAGMERPEAIAPTGDSIDVRFLFDPDQTFHSIDPLDWVVNARDSAPFLKPQAPTAFVFAGSRIVSAGGNERYAGDLGGNVIGLSTFGDEVVALRRVLSPDSRVETPEWVAKLSDTPAPGTPVRVRLRVVRDAQR